jgi:glycosyltransferase involved in cell wall biosynthesis
MKIALVNFYESGGGAAKAVKNLHNALLDKNIDSRLFVVEKSSELETVIGFKKGIYSRILPRLDSLPLKLSTTSPTSPFSLNWLPFKKVINQVIKFDPDIIHLHWIGFGMMKLDELLKINKPIVWTLHDNWAFTGGCHIMYDCKLYQTHCGKCPNLNSKKLKDITYYSFENKKNIFTKISNMYITCPSTWLLERVQESIILNKSKVFKIYNLIDLTSLKPMDKNEAKIKLGIDTNTRVILFGAINAINDRNKGFSLLLEAINKIHEKDFVVLIFGSDGSEIKNFNDKRLKFLGQFNNYSTLNVLYSAADLTVVPSLQENLSTVIIESLALGTPVVAFNIGGNSEQIIHKLNGYLALPYSTEDLSNGINWILDEYIKKESFEMPPNLISKNFLKEAIVEEYLKLYDKILG